MTSEQRLERLERHNRRLWMGLVLLAGAGVTGLMMGQADDEEVPKIIRARSFEVVSRGGKPLVRLEETHGTGVLAGTIKTYSIKGQELVWLGVTQGGSGAVITLNSKGQSLVRLGASKEGEGLATTLNGKGQELVRLGVAENGCGAVTTLDGKGQNLVELTVTEEGEGAVAAYDPAGLPRMLTPWSVR